VVEAGEIRILVDTGSAALSRTREGRENLGRLASGLPQLNLSPGEIDIVLLTHLHSDHVGVCFGAGGASLLFGSARHIVQRSEWENVHLSLASDLRRIEAGLEPIGEDAEIVLGRSSAPCGGAIPRAHGGRQPTTAAEFGRGSVDVDSRLPHVIPGDRARSERWQRVRLDSRASLASLERRKLKIMESPVGPAAGVQLLVTSPFDDTPLWKGDSAETERCVRFQTSVGGPMEIRRFQMATNVIVDFPLRESVEGILGALRAFEDHVRTEAPDSLDAFESEYTHALLRQLPSDVARRAVLEGSDDEFNVLERACVAYILHLLQWPDGLEEIVLEIDRADALRARLYPAFHRMRSLRDVMGAEAAMPFLKNYIDRRIHELTTPDESLEDVDRYWEEIADPDFQSPTSGVAARFHRGKNAFRIDRCLWADLMKPLGDPQVAFLVCCYGDTAGVEALSPHLAYSCPMTLIEGDPFCDKCIHDTRFVDEIDHPARSFFERLGSKDA